MRDSQRSRVYKAERLAWESNSRSSLVMYPTIPEVEDYLKRIFKSAWFKKRYPKIRYYYIGDGRGRSNACGWGSMGVCYMKLPKGSRANWIILHELAHGIIYNQGLGGVVAGHGREYCRVYLSLVKKWIGPEQEKILKEKFKECRVKYRKVPTIY